MLLTSDLIRHFVGLGTSPMTEKRGGPSDLATVCSALASKRQLRTEVSTSTLANYANSTANASRLLASGTAAAATLGRSRLFCKETVPTALVSPQTVPITVQPAATLESSSSLLTSPFRAGAAAAMTEEGVSRFLYAPPTSTLHSHTLTPPPSFTNAMFSNESVYRNRIKSASIVFPSFVSDPWPQNSTNNGDFLRPNSLHMSLGACSDDRLDQLEQRMRLLESRLSDVSSGRSTPTPTHSVSMRELHTSPGGASVANGNGLAADYCSDRIRYLQEQLEQDLDVRLLASNSSSTPPRSWKDREIDALKNRLRELEMENATWKSRYGILNTTNTIHSKRSSFFADVIGRQAAHDEQRAFVKPSSSMGDLAPNEPRPPAFAAETPPPTASFSMSALEPAPDQYVPMQRYRLLKAKSKKLLADKSEAYRTEKQEKESLLVQLQLQNKELSELRNKVYKKNSKTKSTDSVLLGEMKQKYEELMRSLKNCTFASACILGICKDVSAKKCPDYDQILGLKAADGMTSSTLQKSFSHVSFNDEPDSDLVLEQLNELVKNCNENLTEVQKLIVDYYTTELVDSIDCRLQ